MSNSRPLKKPKRRAGPQSALHRDSGLCIGEETLELYVLERLPGQQRRDADDPEVEAVEIHLLTCGNCQTRAYHLELETRELRMLLRQFAEPARPRTFSAGG